METMVNMAEEEEGLAPTLHGLVLIRRMQPTLEVVPFLGQVGAAVVVGLIVVR